MNLIENKMTGKITIKYVFFVLIAVFLSCFFHEFTHWFTGEVLGNDMVMTLNNVYPISDTYKNEWNKNIITISAPIFTVLQAVLFYFIIKKNKKIILYPFLFFPFVYRFFAGLANMAGPNDEGRFGQSLGIGLYTISILFCAFLLFLIYKATLQLKLSLKFNVINFLWCALFLFLIVFINDYFKVKII